MSDALQFGFVLRAPSPAKQTIDELRWSLAVSDPAIGMLSGAFTASDGARVPYRLWPAKKMRAIALLLHGACDYAGAFDEIAPRLVAQGITAFAYDQRGFGGTATRGAWSGKRRMIGDAVEAIGFLRARFGNPLPVFILGESMGGAIAVHTAARHPELKIAGLVLTAPGVVSGMLRRFFWSAVTRLLNAIAPDSNVVVERISNSDLTPGAEIRFMMDPLVLHGVRPAMMAGLYKLARSAMEKAPSVDIPTLTMIGTMEDVVGAQCIAHLHAGLAGEKSWECFEGGPHMLLHWQQGEKVLARALGWIDAHIPQ